MASLELCLESLYFGQETSRIMVVSLELTFAFGCWPMITFVAFTGVRLRLEASVLIVYWCTYSMGGIWTTL